MKISTRLRKFRMDKNMTLREVAQTLGVPVSTYRDWEYGKAIRGEPYEKLAAIFGVSLEALLKNEGEKSPDILTPLLETKRNLDLAIKIAQTL